MQSIEISHVTLPKGAVELPRFSGPGPVNMVSINAGSAFTITGWPEIACGAVLAVVGYAVVSPPFLAAANVIGAPPWVAPAVALLSAALGLYLGADGLSALRHKRATDSRAREMPDKPWLWDHEWREEGIGGDTGGEIAKAFGFALFALVILLPLHWAVLVVKGLPWVVGVGAVIFDVFIVGVTVHGVNLIRMRRRYGTSWLHFRRFPFRTGEKLEASVDGTRGMSDLPSLNATLRCIQERYELRERTNADKELQVVRYALWSATARVDRSAGGAFNFEFEIPADAPSSALRERPSRYWELVIASDDVPGVDYHARFLVPVYSARQGFSSEAS
jgi:hypothetical protein